MAREVQRHQSISAARETADLRGTLQARDEALEDLGRRVEEALAQRKAAEQELEKLRGGKATRGVGGKLSLPEEVVLTRIFHVYCVLSSVNSCRTPTDCI